jgi:hypothetical protein
MNKTKTLLAILRVPQGKAYGGVVAVVGLLFLAAVTLSGCAEPVAIAAVPPTATVYAPPPTDIPALPPEPTPAAMDFPIAAPTRAEVEPVDAQTCVDCHTDEETLKAVATEPEHVESLSEGEG